jgi:hypothetical protein
MLLEDAVKAFVTESSLSTEFQAFLRKQFLIHQTVTEMPSVTDQKYFVIVSDQLASSIQSRLYGVCTVHRVGNRVQIKCSNLACRKFMGKPASKKSKLFCPHCDAVKEKLDSADCEIDFSDTTSTGLFVYVVWNSCFMSLTFHYFFVVADDPVHYDHVLDQWICVGQPDLGAIPLACDVSETVRSCILKRKTGADVRKSEDNSFFIDDDGYLWGPDCFPDECACGNVPLSERKVNVITVRTHVGAVRRQVYSRQCTCGAELTWIPSSEGLHSFNNNKDAGVFVL